MVRVRLLTEGPDLALQGGAQGTVRMDACQQWWSSLTFDQQCAAKVVSGPVPQWMAHTLAAKGLFVVDAVLADGDEQQLVALRPRYLADFIEAQRLRSPSTIA